VKKLKLRNITPSLLALLLAASACGSDDKVALPPDYDPTLNVPLWVEEARIAGADLDSEMLETEIDALLLERQAQNASVLEIDTRLSDYLTDAEFNKEVAFLKVIAEKTHALGMKAVIYYPSLEVLTANGQTAEHSMFKDHPEWIQKGIDGTPNVFYGNKEHWVEEGTESAWMSPNSGYKDYFLKRVTALAKTGLDGIWIDVPVYLETGTKWPGAEEGAAIVFKEWTAAQGMADGAGYDAPTVEDFTSPAFRAWIRWRHENLADFQDAVRTTGMAANPAFVTIVEDFPVDNMDALSTGLDSSWRRESKNLVRVYEIDSVSNRNGMQYSNNEDFDSKIAMNKFAVAAEHENPAWVFSYGNEPEDAGLVMAAAIATGANPFECKTPEMTQSVGSDFRTTWFKFIKDHTDPLFKLPRHADVAVWYSSATRDYQDYLIGGTWGMYVTVDAPSDDPEWWADDDRDSSLIKPHLGGWRAAAHTLTTLAVPFKPVLAPGPDMAADLAGVPFLWLPSVAAMSDAEIAIVKDYVMQGGTLLATGKMPATLDELGNARSNSALADVFGIPVMAPGGDRAQPYGKGYAIYRGSFAATDSYFKAGDPEDAKDSMAELQRIIRIHAPDTLRIDTTTPGLHVELAKESATKHWLYAVNYTGLKEPIVETVINTKISYLPGPGLQVVDATVYSPDGSTVLGAAAVTKTAEGIWSVDVTVDQFALVELNMAPYTEPVITPDYAAPVFTDATRQRAAESGLRFILDKMRPANKPAPASFGVFTNLLDDASIAEIYAHGHHVTAEHMGLLLRVSACMKDEQAFDESYRYVNELMYSQMYGLCNWAIDKDTNAPFIQIGETDDDSTAWLNANAPLDDFRVIRGLIAGAKQLGRFDANDLADVFFRGMLFTSVSDMAFELVDDIPAYPEGLAAFAWDWQEIDNANLTPFPAESSGRGRMTLDPVPIDYQDLYVMGMAAERDPRWLPIVDNATKLLLDSEISNLGIYYNGYQANGVFTGDFENQGITQGNHLKVIQILWIALHLARADVGLTPEQKVLAQASAQRSLDFFKAFMVSSVGVHAPTGVNYPLGRIPEYLTYGGADVATCSSPGVPAGCLEPEAENLIGGEPRIYAQVARLAIWLGDVDYAKQLLTDQVIPEWISNEADPRYGLIGISTAEDNSAEAWNVLESVLTLCMAAGGES
jgi:hypothetical protein